jgi:flagellar assembly protein FliH
MSQSSKVEKFLFDLAFDDEIAMPLHEREKAKPTFSEEQLEQAKKDSYAAGMTAGKNAMQESQQQQANHLLSEIESRMTTLIKASQDKWSDQLKQLRHLLIVITRKILPHYVARHGTDEIEAIAVKTLAEMSQEPRLVIRVAESIFDDMNQRIETITRNQAFVGKVIVLGDPELGVSDCRIEWADGGIEHDQERVWQEIDRIMDFHQDSYRPPEPPPVVESAAKPQEEPVAPLPAPAPEVEIKAESVPESDAAQEILPQQAAEHNVPEEPNQPPTELGEKT